MDQSYSKYNDYEGSGFSFLGGNALMDKIKSNWVPILMAVVIIALIIVIILFITGVIVPPAKAAMVSSFDGNNANWKMGSLDAGASGSLGWGENFKSHMKPVSYNKSQLRPKPVSGFANVSRFDPATAAATAAAAAAAGIPYDASALAVGGVAASTDPAVAAAQAAATQAYLQATSQVVANQNQVLSNCSKPWNTQAVEEAQVLNSIGVYRSPTPGMSGFVRTINGNTTLSDAQLESIMQGGEPLENPTWVPRQGAQIGNTPPVRR
jgi:hypothetical protein